MSKPVVSAPCIEGAAIIEAIKRAGVEFVVSVPDRVTSETVLRPIASDPSLRLVRVCKDFAYMHPRGEYSRLNAYHRKRDGLEGKWEIRYSTMTF